MLYIFELLYYIVAIGSFLIAVATFVISNAPQVQINPYILAESTAETNITQNLILLEISNKGKSAAKQCKLRSLRPISMKERRRYIEAGGNPEFLKHAFPERLYLKDFNIGYFTSGTVFIFPLVPHQFILSNNEKKIDDFVFEFRWKILGFITRRRVYRIDINPFLNNAVILSSEERIVGELKKLNNHNKKLSKITEKHIKKFQPSREYISNFKKWIGYPE